ncbi:hypothetical protein BO85DRAFT_60894 [Aspergillus piperis CBS 112811]|uniref:Uncharacterized protein n=1 Tax=Aspergillus piperis CBS 112811 TaxID=1448313 RepID=A0A8G1VMY6_9EURO|nr:hypothetical protein BO85DRAFT_60894 [Aspergillus piperis CBS 112811]RAH56183.1 hypothetical protein BO85DRAFT_60894 [Aspergillus piperis CBS 112811]
MIGSRGPCPACSSSQRGECSQFPSNAPAATGKLGNQAAKLGHQIRGREDATSAYQFRPATAPTNYLSSLRLPSLHVHPLSSYSHGPMPDHANSWPCSLKVRAL